MRGTIVGYINPELANHPLRGTSAVETGFVISSSCQSSRGPRSAIPFLGSCFDPRFDTIANPPLWDRTNLTLPPSLGFLSSVSPDFVCAGLPDVTPRTALLTALLTLTSALPETINQQVTPGTVPLVSARMDFASFFLVFDPSL